MKQVTAEAIPVVGWRDSETRWLDARRTGVSASDVSAVLGFGPYRTPWEVWAEKTGRPVRLCDAERESIRLGVALEPWLLAQARHLAADPTATVIRTPARLYAHPEHPWRLASPDGAIADSAGAVMYGVEAKTAGLASGYGTPDEWSDHRAPLGYEFQCRWQMHVMGWERVDLVALVAGLGLRTYTFERDRATETDMVAQVGEWRECHLVRGDEPPMTARDNALMDATYPAADGTEIELDEVGDLVEQARAAYRAGLAAEKDGRARKEAATARLKAVLGPASVGTVDGEPVVTWNECIGKVDYPALVEDLIEIIGWSGPLLDVEDLLDKYRKPKTRSISVKGIK